MQTYSSKVELLLRIGVAFAFIYPPVSALINPIAWTGYFPAFVFSILPFTDVVILNIFGAFGIAIGLWILFGKKIVVPSLMAAATLLIIVAFNVAQIDVIFRDLSIALMSLALALTNYKKYAKSSPSETTIE